MDIASFITTNLRLEPSPASPDIRLYTAHPGSRLSRLQGHAADASPPYWAYSWAGGTVLAQHILKYPHIVSGRRVLDLGAGSGLVAIAAAKCGAVTVAAAEIDSNAATAIRLNAVANGVAVEVLLLADGLPMVPPAVDIILAGDVFYDPDVAADVLPFLVKSRAAGIDVLIGDPFRRPLPADQLTLLAEYTVPDFGGSMGDECRAGVFAISPDTARQAAVSARRGPEA
ncbi:methyltransferase [Rhizobium grahamii]|uniref:Methyltransferase n=1 Tax=Rhizobium grahamii TaxID=1120045 RepID=A0A5Q0C4F1_9HYPH|nr:MULTISPECIES: 50S ribosomal protein L11 methyltransferase [Rhizobium]QFY60125.1 methyltransferase [Rhizobium grahamii]QRM50756.1 methyltransferase [Rhizobium sp. BG6]